MCTQYYCPRCGQQRLKQCIFTAGSVGFGVCAGVEASYLGIGCPVLCGAGVAITTVVAVCCITHCFYGRRLGMGFCEYLQADDAEIQQALIPLIAAQQQQMGRNPNDSDASSASTTQTT